LSTNERDLLLPYLGQRNYLQLTTLFAALLPYFQNASDVSLRVSRPLLCNRVRLILADAAAETPAAAGLDCWWREQGGGGKIFLVDGDSHVPEFRVPYPENLAIAGWRADSSGAVVEGASPYTTAERLIALNKAYLSRLHPLSEAEQYLATRLDVGAPFAASRSIRVQEIRTIGREHHASRVSLDGRDAGTLYFARKPRQLLVGTPH
jgi:hypothetical protein